MEKDESVANINDDMKDDVRVHVGGFMSRVDIPIRGSKYAERLVVLTGKGYYIPIDKMKKWFMLQPSFFDVNGYSPQYSLYSVSCLNTGILMVRSRDDIQYLRSNQLSSLMYAEGGGVRSGMLTLHQIDDTPSDDWISDNEYHATGSESMKTKNKELEFLRDEIDEHLRKAKHMNDTTMEFLHTECVFGEMLIWFYEYLSV